MPFSEETVGGYLSSNCYSHEEGGNYALDDNGNITCRREYAYTTGSLDSVTPLDTVTYTYGDSEWGDLLTGYDGRTITYDGIGNPLTDGTWEYTWEHGRQLASMTDGSTTWSYSYNTDGMRTSRTNGTTTYTYVYNGTHLSQMTVDGNTLDFVMDTNGSPIAVVYNGSVYYYARNYQGDVVAIVDDMGYVKVRYIYDAWGNLLTTTEALADTLGKHNPFRYRGYVYDVETGLYYVSSRYYDPEIGRWINADGVVAGIGENLLGYNMFAYCFNNPVNMTDNSGHWPQWIKDAVDWVNDKVIQPVVSFVKDIAEDINNFDLNNESEEKVLESNYFSSYKGVPVIRTNGDRSGSFGAIFLTRETNNRSNPEDVIRHEYGHTKQLEQLGIVNYALCIGLPSWQQWGTGEYYSKPWEITADIYGGVQSRNHSQSNIDRGFAYLEGSKIIGPLIWVFIE